MAFTPGHFHLSVQVIGRAAEAYPGGRSIVASAAYRAGCSLRDEGRGITFRFPKPEVVHSEILAPADSPAWCRDRAVLWNRVEQSEKRKDAQLAREMEFAIPVGLPRHLWNEYARQQLMPLVDAGMVVDFSIHDKPGNPHIHAMATTRRVEGEGFGQKAREWNDRGLVEQWRKSWETICNGALRAAGRQERVSRRSLAAQGIQRAPQVHVGVAAWQMAQRGIPSDRWDRNEGIKRSTNERTESKRPAPARRPRANSRPAPHRSPTIPTTRPWTKPRGFGRSGGGAEGVEAPLLGVPTVGEVGLPDSGTPDVGGAPAPADRVGVESPISTPGEAASAKPQGPGLVVPIAAPGGVAEGLRRVAEAQRVVQQPGGPTPGLAIQGHDAPRAGRPGAGPGAAPAPALDRGTRTPNVAPVDRPERGPEGPARAVPTPGSDRGDRDAGRDPKVVPPAQRPDGRADGGGKQPAPGGPGGRGPAPVVPPAPAPAPSVQRSSDWAGDVDLSLPVAPRPRVVPKTDVYDDGLGVLQKPTAPRKAPQEPTTTPDKPTTPPRPRKP